jgi:hypothetical protein
MCVTCHSNPSPAALASAHGDGNPDCVRESTVSLQDQRDYAGSSYLSPRGTMYRCVDCGELVRAMDSEDHSCYTDG